MRDVYNYPIFERDDDPYQKWRELFRAGDAAPDFTGHALDGQTVRLADFRGKSHVLLEFGAIT